MMMFPVMKLYSEAEIGKIISRERMVSVCPKEGTVFLGCCRLSLCTRVLCMCVCAPMYAHMHMCAHACTCIHTH